MLGTVTETRILSNPHLTVEEGKEAKIEVIEKQPYEEDTTTTASGGTTTASKSYQWVNVGVTLNVTARINKDGNINMIEASARQVKEEELEEALKIASAEITKIENFQKNIKKD